MAVDRAKWRKATPNGITPFEKERIKHAAYKRAVRKKELTATPYDTKDMKCEICGKICLSRAGFISHTRGHKDVEKVQYPQQLGLKCVKCGKVVKSKAGMKNHLRSHARKEAQEDNPRRHTRRRVDN